MEVMCWTALSASAPAISISPMWDDVEEPGARAHRHVLVGDAGVFDRHVPAAELDHAGAVRAVPRVERCLFQCAGRWLCHVEKAGPLTYERYYAPAVFGKRQSMFVVGFA